MGFKIGRSSGAPVLETRNTARFGEQKIVATETPVVEVSEVPAEEEVIEQPVVEQPAPAKRGRRVSKKGKKDGAGDK